MGGGGGVVIFTPWCFMVLPTTISSHCAGPLAFFKVPLLSIGGGGGVLIFTPLCFMVLPTKINSHCADPLACFKNLSHPWGEGVEF